MERIVQRLLEKGANPDKRRCLNPVHLCAQLVRLHCLQWILTKHINLVDIPVDGGQIPLHFATSRGHIKVLKFLLNNGANPFLLLEMDSLQYMQQLELGNPNVLSTSKKRKANLKMNLQLIEQASFHGLHNMGCLLAQTVSNNPCKSKKKKLSMWGLTDLLQLVYRNSEQFSGPQFNRLVREIAIKGAKTCNYCCVEEALLLLPTFMNFKKQVEDLSWIVNFMQHRP